MNVSTLHSEIAQLQQQIVEKRKKLVELRKQLPINPVKNYEFLTSTGKSVTLLELFGDKKELLMVHNMGKSCPYCTMWADGFNGVYHHLIEKCAFVLSTPDDPEVQDSSASERQWKFPIVSTKGTTFKEDFGFMDEKDFVPGISVFVRDNADTIYHVTDDRFGPWDDYCIVWNLFDLLPSGSSGFHPKFKINKPSSFDLTNNIALVVQNMNEAVFFYKNSFGMAVENVSENEAQVNFGGHRFYLKRADKDEDIGHVFFELATEDFSERLSELLNLGCTVINEFGPTSVLIKDPFGMKFHLFESVRMK